MYVIFCEELREKYDIFLWNQRKGHEFLNGDYLKEMIEEIDVMQEKYYLSTHCKLFLFDLAEKGQAIIDNRVSMKIVEEVLEESGYTFTTEELNI